MDRISFFILLNIRKDFFRSLVQNFGTVENTLEMFEGEEPVNNPNHAVVYVDYEGDILLFDPINKVIANIHSGWKGTLNQLLSKTIELMIKEYGTNPKDLIAYISPCIQKCCFEVDEELANEFGTFDQYMNIKCGNQENCTFRKISERRILRNRRRAGRIRLHCHFGIIARRIAYCPAYSWSNNACRRCTCAVFAVAKDLL